jgi:hypothetical protein
VRLQRRLERVERDTCLDRDCQIGRVIIEYLVQRRRAQHKGAGRRRSAEVLQRSRAPWHNPPITSVAQGSGKIFRG